MAMDQGAEPAAITFSFLVTVFEQAESLPIVHKQLHDVAEKTGEPYEIIFVDDGSSDESGQIIRRLRADDERVKYVELSRHFGRQQALSAGLDCARGAAVITVDPACPHPPELLGRLIEQWRLGYEVVYTVRTEPEAPTGWKRRASRAWRGVLKGLCRFDAVDQADFLLLDRKVVDSLRRVRRELRLGRGLIGWMGFRQLAMPLEAAAGQARPAGCSLGRLAGMAATAAFNFSVLPLRLIGLVGLIVAAAAMLYGIAALICWPILGTAPMANWAMLAVGLAGVQLAILGVLGELVVTLCDETRDRPAYVIREAAGFETPEEEQAFAHRPPREAVAAEPSQIRLFT